jgi:hypothetical protein
MTTMVCFESGGVSYCVPVEATRAVRPATGDLVFVTEPDAFAARL